MLAHLRSHGTSGSTSPYSLPLPVRGGGKPCAAAVASRGSVGMKIRSLLAGFALLALAITLLVGTAVWHARAASERTELEQLRAHDAARQMASLLVLTHEYARGFDERSLQQWRLSHRELMDTLSAAALVRSATALRHEFDDLVGMVARQEDSPLASRRAELLVDHLLSETQALGDNILIWSREAAAAQRQAELRFHRTAMLGVALLVLVLLLQGAVIVFKVLRRLDQLEDATLAVASGNLSARIALDSGDEFGRLARRFDAMTEALASRDDALRRQVELTQASERRLRTLADTVPVLIMEWGADERLVFANRMACQVFGLDPARAAGMSLLDVNGPAVLAAMEPHLDAVRWGCRSDFESQWAIDGTKRCFQRTLVPKLQADGRSAGFYSVAMDVTERKSLEQRVAASERFVRNITDHLPIRIAYLDEQLRYQFVNQVHCERFARPRAQIIGRRREELVGDSERGPAAALHLAAALAGAPQRFESEEHVAGQLRRIESQVVPDVDEGGHVHGLFMTGVDITERDATERALRELTEILENSSDFIVQADWRGRLNYANPAARRALGGAPDGVVVGRPFGDFNTPATNDRFLREIKPAVKAHGVWLGETEMLVHGGRVVPVAHMVIAHRDAGGRIGRYSAVMRDITEAVRARNELFRQTATLGSIAEAIPAVVVVVDGQQRYRFVNAAFERWRGEPRERVLGRSLVEVMGPDEHAQTLSWIERALRGEAVNFERRQVRDGRERYLSVSYIPLRDAGGAVDGFVGIGQDITAHREEAQRLIELSEHDGLTGLLNRQGFDSYLQRNHRALLEGEMALLYIDLDHFKPVNDRHGHAAGDAVLRLFAERLQALVRPSDAVARLGGDEFAVVLPSVQRRSVADGVARKVVHAAGEAFCIGELQVHIGASVGVALAGDDGVAGLMARADAAVYRAKLAGRGQLA